MNQSQKHLKKNLRSIMLAKRCVLGRCQILRASRDLAAQMHQQPRLLKAQTLFSYVPHRGEIDPVFVHHTGNKKKVYLPRIENHRLRRMYFYEQAASMRQNKFGIGEPQGGSPLAIHCSDAILVPLVAFDRRGGRLGWGGGYYDKMLGEIVARAVVRHPLVVGLAHHFQEVDRVPCEPWDIALDVIVTDKETIWPTQTKNG